MCIFVGGYTEESLLVVRGLGVQISTTSWSGGRSSRFIPTSRVCDLWIHEGFRGFEVKFYLAVVVEEEEGLVVVFPVGSLRSLS
jgi:phosphatidylinositol glycan class H protein